MADAAEKFSTSSFEVAFERHQSLKDLIQVDSYFGGEVSAVIVAWGTIYWADFRVLIEKSHLHLYHHAYTVVKPVKN